MKIAGFTIVKNAIKYDYPIVEAITSVLPLCDEFIVAVGNGEDNTLDLIQAINSPKIRDERNYFMRFLKKSKYHTSKWLAAIFSINRLR